MVDVGWTISPQSVISDYPEDGEPVQEWMVMMLKTLTTGEVWGIDGLERWGSWVKPRCAVQLGFGQMDWDNIFKQKIVTHTHTSSPSPQSGCLADLKGPVGR